MSEPPMRSMTSSVYTVVIFLIFSKVMPPPGVGTIGGMEPRVCVHPFWMSTHSCSLNPNLPPKEGKMVESAPASRGMMPRRTLCEKPRHSCCEPPPSIAPRMAGWHTMGRPKFGSSARCLMVSTPVMPGIMSTAPAPAALANLARWTTRCAGAFRQGA